MKALLIILFVIMISGFTMNLRHQEKKNRVATWAAMLVQLVLAVWIGTYLFK